MRALIEIDPKNCQLYIDQLLAIENASFSEPWSREAYLAEVSRPISHLVAVVEGEELLAYGGFWQVIDTAEVNNIAVAEKWRGQGIGRLLVDGMLDLAAMLGMEQMNLEVRAGNVTAIGLYLGAGFQEVGRRAHYYQSPPEDALLLTCELGGRHML